MKLYTGLTALLCLFLSGFSGSVHALKKGDLLPDISLPHILNYPGGSGRTSDFESGLMIIDFWRTYCGPCLRLFPDYGSLEGAFDGRLHFLLVTAEDEARVKQVLDRLHCGLPCVCRDSMLDKLFPHNSIPHEVWLMNGRVVGFSYGEDVNARNIQRVLDGFGLDDEKEDDLGFDQHQPLLANGNGSGPVLSQSVITPYLAHLRSNMGYGVFGDRIVSDAINTTVCALYQHAAERIDPLLGHDNRMLLEVPDSLTDVMRVPKGVAAHEWLQSNGFCYDLVLPCSFKGDVGQVMLDELNRYFSARFGICGVLERRKVMCWVLSRGSGRLAVSTAGNTAYMVNDSLYRQRGLPLSSFVSLLAYQYRHMALPLIDGASFNGNVDLVISGDRSDPLVVDRQLRLYGLRLRCRKKSVLMLVIRSFHSADTKLNLKQ